MGMSLEVMPRFAQDNELGSCDLIGSKFSVWSPKLLYLYRKKEERKYRGYRLGVLWDLCQNISSHSSMLHVPFDAYITMNIGQSKALTTTTRISKFP